MSSCGGGGTISPFLRSHSTSRLSSSHRVGQKKHSLHSPMISTHNFGLVQSPSFFPSSRRELSSHFLRHRNSALFFLTQGAGETIAVTQDFLGVGAIHARRCVPMCSILVLVVGVCLLADYGHVCCRLWSAFMFSPVHAGSLASFPFVDCVMLPSFHCEIGAVVFPWLGCCVCKYLFGLLLSCFGHARAKNNSDSSC